MISTTVFPRSWRRPNVLGAVRRLRVIGPVSVAAAGASVALVVVFASPPPAATSEGLDGRTWLAVQRGSSSAFVLLNGFSGLVEASAKPSAGVPADARFINATTGRTLFGTASSVTVVDNGHHDVTSVPVDGTTSILVGGSLWSVGTRVEQRPADLSGGPVVRATGVRPVTGVPPVADDLGSVWYLGSGPGGRLTAVGLNVDGAARKIAVSASTRRLTTIDGGVYAVSPESVGAVGGGRTMALPPNTVVTAATAVETRGVWASAAGSTVTFFQRGLSDTKEQQLDDGVNALAVWHGEVVAVTGSGVYVGAPGRLRKLPDVGAGATMHADGGFLWVSTNNEAMALGPELDQVPFKLTDASLSLCVDDCSAQAAARFLQLRAYAKAVKDNASGAPPKAREVASKADAPKLQPITTKLELPTRTAAEGTDLESATTSTTPPVSVGPPAGGEVVVDPSIQADVTLARPPTADAPLPDDGAAGLVLGLESASGQVVATIGVVGTPRQCGIGQDRSTPAGLSWSGAAEGSRLTSITWASSSAGHSDLSTATIPARGGEVTVTLSVCNVTTQVTTVVPGAADGGVPGLPPPADAPVTTVPSDTTVPESTTSTTDPSSTTTTDSTGSTDSTTTTTTEPPTTTTTEPPTTTTEPPTTTTVDNGSGGGG